MTKREFEKLCRGVRKDTMADFPDASEDIFYDVADSLLHDSQIKNYVEKIIGKDRMMQKEYLAESISG